MKRPRSSSAGVTICLALSAEGTKLPSLAGLAPPGWLSLSITPSSSYAYDPLWDGEPSAAAVVASGGGEASSAQPVPAPGFFVPLLAVSSDVGAEPAEVEEAFPAPPPPEPAWIRAEYFPSIPISLPLHFIGKKTIQESDLSLEQCRFLIPRGDIYHLLHPLLSDDERVAADMVEPPHRPQKDPAAVVVGILGKKQYDGLKVYVIVDVGRDRRRRRIEAKLSRWDSAGNIVLKFNPYRYFVGMSDLRVKERVRMWAFRYRERDTLHLVIAKTDYGDLPLPQPQPLPPLPHADGGALAAVKVEEDQA